MDWNGQNQPPPPQKNFDEFFHELLDNPGRLLRMLALVLGAAALLTSIYTVQPEEEAVLLRFGKYIGTTGPGLNFKLPFGVDSVTKLKTKARLQESFGFFSESSLKEGGQSSGDLAEESLMLTGDLNVADVQWVVQYSISNAKNFLFNVRDPRKNIRDISQAVMRRVVGDRTVNEVLTVGRERIADEAQQLTQQILDQYNMGVKIELVTLQDVNPPEPVQSSFNDVNAAKQEAEQLINRAEANYNKVIPEARGKAEEEISTARGYATATINRARGDAEKISRMLKEYRSAPEVTRTRLYLDTMEEIFKRFKSVTIIDPDVKGVLPIFGGQLTAAKDLSVAGGQAPSETTNFTSESRSR